MYSGTKRSPVSTARTITVVMNVKVLDKRDKAPGARRVKLELHTSDTSVVVWVTLPVNTLHCIERSMDPVQADVKIGHYKVFTFEKIKFSLGDARGQWFQLDSKE